MADIALVIDPATQRPDWATTGVDLQTDDGLMTALILTFGIDRRADASDALPAGDDPRGWWGDIPADTTVADRWGWKGWLRRRSKLLLETQRQLEQDARDATQWLLDDGIAAAVSIDSEVLAAPLGTILMKISILRKTATGVAAARFDYAWTVTVGSAP